MDDIPFSSAGITASPSAAVGGGPAIGGADGLGGFVVISVRRAQHIASLSLTGPSLTLVECGSKTVHFGGQTRVFEAGMVLALGHGVTLDLTNTPDPVTGEYRALCLNFDSALVRELWQSRGPSVTAVSAPFAALKATRSLNEALHHAVQGLSHADEFPPQQLRHRLLEVLLVLEAQGFRAVAPANVGTADAVRALLEAQPQRRWTCATAASALHVSEASLRRRLADEGLAFRALLDEVRLSLAMGLLHGTRKPVALVAQACGYQSASKFAARFRARYGLSPSQLRD